MDILDQIEGVLDDLLGYRGCDPGQHQKGRLDGVVRSDDVDGPGHIHFGSQNRRKELAVQIAVVFGHEAVVCLCFDVLECCEEGRVAEGVFDEGEAPAGEYAARTDLAKLAAAVLPHCGVLAA